MLCEYVYVQMYMYILHLFSSKTGEVLKQRSQKINLNSLLDLENGSKTVFPFPNPLLSDLFLAFDCVNRTLIGKEVLLHAA